MILGPGTKILQDAAKEIRKLKKIRPLNNKVLLYSTENYIQYSMINHNGKEYKKKNVYICITESLLYSRN